MCGGVYDARMLIALEMQSTQYNLKILFRWGQFIRIMAIYSAMNWVCCNEKWNEFILSHFIFFFEHIMTFNANDYHAEIEFKSFVMDYTQLIYLDSMTIQTLHLINDSSCTKTEWKTVKCIKRKTYERTTDT